MDTVLVLALHAALYATLPLIFAAVSSTMRLALLYVHLGIVLTVGGYLSQVYAVPLWGDVQLGGGNIAYGAFMMTAVLLVIVGRDLQVVRNIVKLVIAVNLFKFGLVELVAYTLRSDTVVNPFDAEPEIFSSSTRVVILGGLLNLGEILLLTAFFEQVKRRPRLLPALPALYLLAFVAVLLLDGLLFPVLVLFGPDASWAGIWTGVQAKSVLAVMFGIPLLLFLLLYRGRVARYAATPLNLSELFGAQREDLVEEIERQRDELAANQARSLALVQSSSDMVAILDMETRLLFANPATRRLLGLSREDLESRPMLELIHPEDRQRAAERFRLAVAGADRGERSTMRYRIRNADGDWRMIEAVATSELQNPAIAGIVVNARDITEQEEDVRLLEAHREVLAMVAAGEPVDACLRAVDELVAQRAPCSVVATYVCLDPGGHHLHRVLFSSEEPSAPAQVAPVAVESLTAPVRQCLKERRPVSSRLAEEDLARQPEVVPPGAIAVWGHAAPVTTDSEAGPAGIVALYVERELDDRLRGALTLAVTLVQVILERKADVDRLVHLAMHDELTGLPNRALLVDRLDQALSAEIRDGTSVAVIFVDLDNFKLVNDSLGHSVGDELLRSVAERLTRAVRPGDTVARFGGDEFVLLATALTDEQEALRLAERVRQALREPIVVAGQARASTASIGVAVDGEAADTADRLLAQADAAMYRAKAAGRDRITVFDEGLHRAARVRLDTEAALRRAIEHDELVLHFQPQIDLATGRLAGMEALVRWDRPGHGLVFPAAFVPVAEESDLIIALGEWVLAESCRQVAEWTSSGHNLEVSVNISPRQLIRGDISRRVRELVQSSGIPPELLCLELTETALMEDVPHLAGALDRITDLGVRISIDDFGTGYSSLLYLKRLPVSELKIDLEFVQGLPHDAEDAAIVRGVVSLAEALNLETVAEGVETEEQRAAVAAIGCTRMQGYLVARPAPAVEIAGWLDSHRAS